MEPWLELLRAGRSDAAWESFIAHHHRLVFAAIRHYVADHDEVMDAFAHACDALRRDDCARLRRYVDQPAGTPRARFSTWLVTVVRHQTVDWLRQRDGRPRRQAPSHLTSRQQHLWRLIHQEGQSHRDAFHILASSDTSLSDHDYRADLTAVAAAAPAAPVPRRAALRTAGPLPLSLADQAPAGTETGLEELEQALAALPDDERLALQLFVVDEVPAADVARIVGWPNAKAVYNRVGRILRALRHTLQGGTNPAAARRASK